MVVYNHLFLILSFGALLIDYFIPTQRSVITMATTKSGNAKSVSRTINYPEKRAVEKSGLNCDVDYAKSDFKQTRAVYGKKRGSSAYDLRLLNLVKSRQNNVINLA